MGKIRKILTYEQLIKFCAENKFYSFNSKDSGYTLSVQVPGNLSFENKSVKGKLYTQVKVCHTLLNRNGSFVSEENMKAAMPSLVDSPLLGYIHQLDDGTYDFHSHDIEIIEDENGEEQLVYKEHQIGSFTADEPYLEYDKDMDKTYVIATAAIPEEYTKAADIIRRKGGTKVSCELCIESMSYNAKEKYLELEDFYFSGVTCLGCEKDGTEIGEGMLGSRLDIKDFSTENNSICSHYTADTKLIETLEKLNDTLTTISNFNINNAEGKEDNQVPKFEELLEKYGKTVEDITFDYEGLSDEELEVAFAEAFEEDKEVESAVSEEEHVEEESEEESIEENGEEGSEEEIENEEAEETFTNKWSVIDSNGTIHEFELSLDDIQSALYNLINDTYSEADNAWYSVSVYDSHVIMHDWWNSKNYKQTYKRDGDSFTLTGDRVEVFANWLTKDEENSLAELRSNYSSIKAELETYQKAEATAKKDALFTSDEYKVISGETEFKELSNNHVEFSYEELKTKLDSIVLSYVKSGNLKFSNEETKSNRIAFSGASATEKKKPYGNLFK